jgi:hypothetical protein
LTLDSRWAGRFRGSLLGWEQTAWNRDAGLLMLSDRVGEQEHLTLLRFVPMQRANLILSKLPNVVAEKLVELSQPLVATLGLSFPSQKTDAGRNCASGEIAEREKLRRVDVVIYGCRISMAGDVIKPAAHCPISS